jgi:hypothetical protein
MFLLLGVNRRNSNLLVTTACRPALENLNKAAESTDWRPIPNLEVTIFGNDVLCQRGTGPKVRLDICPPIGV